MSIAIEKGWEWLEAELHHAVELTLQSTPPDGVKVAVKRAVTEVLDRAKAELGEQESATEELGEKVPGTDPASEQGELDLGRE